MADHHTPKRAIGIIRVSQVHGRDGDKFMSPAIQRQRIERDCERLGLELIAVYEEMDVSGGKPLAQRHELRKALIRCESDRAEAIVFAYRDRVDRSIDTNSELCRRMDAKGALLIADGQQITHSTVTGWQHATLGSFLSESQRRVLGERMTDVRRRCVEERGVAPFELPPGYKRRKDGVAEPDEDTRLLIVAAFSYRKAGHSIREIRSYLDTHGIKQSESQVRRMLKNRIYLGELHVKGFEPNLHAHEPIVTQELFDAVQAFNGTPRGRLGRSNRLLARQKLLTCGTCGSHLSVSVRGAKDAPDPNADYRFMYRCTNNTCPGRASISAPMIEGMVIDTTRELCHGLVGRASGEAQVQRAKEALDGARMAFDDRLRTFVDLELMDEPQVIEKVQKLRAARTEAQGAYDAALAEHMASQIAVNADAVLEHGSLEGKRELIRAVVERVVVGKGKGPERVEIVGKVA